MFLIGKLLGFLTSPLTWLLLASFWFAYKMQKKELYWATIVIYLVSCVPFANLALSLWQYDLPPWNSLQSKHKVAVVLGGFTNPMMPPYDRVYLGRGGDRFTHSVRVFKEGKADKLLLTGGFSVLHGYAATEAAQMAELFTTSGVPPQKLILEHRARTTAENAINSRELLSKYTNPGDTILLITSAWHMRRAMACFEKQGFICKPWPVDPQAPSACDIYWLQLAPSTDAWQKWELLLHEIVGLVAYKLTGKA